MKSIVLGACAALMLSGVASAQSDVLRSDLDWYVRGAVGLGSPGEASINGEDEDILLGGRVSGAFGVQPLSYLRGEVEILLSGNDLDTDLNSQYRQTAILLNVIGELPVTDRWGAFVGAGYGFSSTELDLDDGFEAQDEADDVTQIFAGASYKLDERITLEGSLRRIGAANVSKGNLSISDADSTDLMFGVRFRP